MDIEFIVNDIDKRKIDGIVIYKHVGDDPWPKKMELTKQEMINLYYQLHNELGGKI